MSNGVSAITLFAGAGGWDLGFAACDVPILAAFNHNKRSLATHRLNFASTRQVLTDITKDDPAEYPHATILQASPECRYQSNAKGEKRHSKNKACSRKKLLSISQNQPPLWPEMPAWTDGEEAEPAARSRATMNEVTRWVRAKREQGHPFQLVFVENVPEVRYWRGYRPWLAEMEALGYQVQILYFNSMFAPSFPAPCYESRDRWYAVCSLADLPRPDLAIRPAAFCQWCARQVGARQSWKPGRDGGRYDKQYTYCCPICGRRLVPFHRSAREVLDWTLPAETIGSRKSALVEETYRNIEAGLTRHRHLPQFILSYYGKALTRTVDQPLGTITTKPRHALITVPHPEATVAECGYRMVTFAECRRAMGYPPSFRFECGDTEALRQIGLSVTPAVAAMLVRRGLAALGCRVREEVVA